MIGTLLKNIFEKASFNILMFALGFVGIVYLCTQQWPPHWTCLNAIIFIITYDIILIMKYLHNKIRSTLSLKKENKQWKKEVLKEYYSLPREIQDNLLRAYTCMDENKANKTRRQSRNIEHNNLCKYLKKVNFRAQKKIFAQRIPKPYVVISENNGMWIIDFDPVICKILESQKNTFKEPIR